ncbi:hypothetical protein KIW84_014184 [Lathyrus oleraceus]|uniref:Rhamnogalacturonan lyase domain-containing protein n=1 Tax=Pisum sativum TaxID=3888 RepID=A0A9D5BMA8_PEA|nr:hypothetical protein KIW84_014184 [Pisum sativum]
MQLCGESTADNCQILQSRVNRLKSDKYQIDSDKLKGYSCDINFTATSNEDVEYKYLPSCPDDEPQKKINQGTILSNIQWKKFGLLCFVWIAVLLLQIAKTPVTVGVSMYQAIGLYQGKKITVSKQDHGTHWPLHLLIVSLSCALLAGILGGLLGVGSGFVMGPLFIEFGIAPQVASATATLGMTFTASISVAQYFLLNRFPVPYALYLTIVATIAAYIGQKIIDRLVNIFQRASLIIFVLSFTILVSAIALGEYRQYGLWERYAELYPNEDLIYTVGVSDYTKDWLYAQVTRKKNEDIYEGTTWQIKFNLDDVEKDEIYKLRLALASANVSELQVRVNSVKQDPPIFSTGVIGKDYAIGRHGIHGLYWLFNIDVPSLLLFNGDNTIFLTQTMAFGPLARFQGIMYDYIRLEGPDSCSSY